MSRENVELVRRSIDEFNRSAVGGDPAPLVRLVQDFAHPESEYQPVEEAVVIRGHDELVEYYRRWLEAWDELRFEVEEMMEAGNQVLATYLAVGRGTGSGVESNSASSSFTRYGTTESCVSASTWTATKRCERLGSASR